MWLHFIKMFTFNSLLSTSQQVFKESNSSCPSAKDINECKKHCTCLFLWHLVCLQLVLSLWMLLALNYILSAKIKIKSVLQWSMLIKIHYMMQFSLSFIFFYVEVQWPNDLCAGIRISMVWVLSSGQRYCVVFLSKTLLHSHCFSPITCINGYQ